MINLYTFKQLGIDVSSYNGWEASKAHAYIVQHVADIVTGAKGLPVGQHVSTHLETLYDWPLTAIDFVAHTVKLQPLCVDTWCQINM